MLFSPTHTINNDSSLVSCSFLSFLPSFLPPSFLSSSLPPSYPPSLLTPSSLPPQRQIKAYTVGDPSVPSLEGSTGSTAGQDPSSSTFTLNQCLAEYTREVHYVAVQCSTVQFLYLLLHLLFHHPLFLFFPSSSSPNFSIPSISFFLIPSYF